MILPRLFLPCVSAARRSLSKWKSPLCKIFSDRKIKLPNYAAGKNEYVPDIIAINDGESVNNVREACHKVRNILSEMKLIIAPGISTGDLEAFLIEKCLEYHVYPSALAYQDYPRSI